MCWTQGALGPQTDWDKAIVMYLGLTGRLPAGLPWLQSLASFTRSIKIGRSDTYSSSMCCRDTRSETCTILLKTMLHNVE